MAEPYDPAAHVRLYGDSKRASGGPLSGIPGRQNSLNPQDNNQPKPSAQMLKIQKTQEEINLVKYQLASNIDAIQERGERLDHLQDKTDKLSIQSQSFKTHATAVRRNMWWKNLKWTICIGVLVFVVIAGAVGGAVRGHQIVEERKTVTQTVPAPTPSM